MVMPAPGRRQTVGADQVRVRRNVRIPMRDGRRLAADLYFPSSHDPGERYPVVMELLPYRKDENTGDASLWSRLPAAGYIFARVDIRGTGGSEGASTDEYLPQEQEDGYDLIEWLAAQDFCDGHVNMIGISYGGFNSLQIATHQPPHLTSIIPIDFTDDRYTDDCHYRGGSLRGFYDVTDYGTKMVAWNALPPAEDLGPDWATVWSEHLEHNTPYLLNWLRYQTDGPYWRHGSVGDIAGRIGCPVFLIGGWKDGYPNPPLRLYEKLRSPKKVLIGPWNHELPDLAVPGPRIDYLREVVRWLDHWCKSRDTGIMDEPPVVLFIQRPTPGGTDRLDSNGTWRAEREWPPPAGREAEWFLAAQGQLSGDAGASGSDQFTYLPTVGTTSGLWSGGSPFGLPGDQRPDEALSLVFTGPALTSDTCILGRPRAVLHVSSTAQVAAFSVSLACVGPDGSSELVSKGYLNATRRKSLTSPEPLIPGEIYELDIELDMTAYCFPAGHRIRVAVAGSDWPNIWPTPEAAISTVLRGEDRPSRVVLPLAGEGSAEPPGFVPSGASVQRHRDELDPPSWVVTEDQLTGRKSVSIRARYRTRPAEGTLVERVDSGRADADPGRPGAAAVTAHHLTRITRGGTSVEATAQTVLSSTEDAFHLAMDVEVTLNGRSRYRKAWVESVPRCLM
jgi:putative CocE/NonD family hydrolase